jgi:PAS domain S-box-containing protein
MKDAEGKYAFVNRLVEHYFDRPLAEWLGKTDKELLSADLAEEYDKHDAQVLATNKSLAFEEHGRTPDGRYQSLLSVKFPFVDASGKRFVAGMSLDISDQKQAEQNAQHDRQRLQLALAAGQMGSHVVDDQ